jgi:threonylcarbamoyladenosine tRNA methylthiotransferase MtaB
LSSIEPLEVTPELVDLVAREPRMARHFHVPLQSGSNRVLRAMYRPYQREYYSELVLGIRSRIPDASIGADVMVAFPGETDDEFLETYRLIEQLPMTYLHVFPYSSRPGTVAASLASPIPDHVAKFRSRALRSLIAGKNEVFRKSFAGSSLDVLVLDDGSAISSNFIRVAVPADCPVNEWIRVKVTGIDEGGLQASRMTTAEENV